MKMARNIKRGESIYIPFLDGEAVLDSQNRPRTYKSVEQFKKCYPAFRLEKPELVEYAPAIHETPMLRYRPERYEKYEEYGLNESGEMLYFRRVLADEKNYAMYCPACGKRLCSRFRSFCPNCGAKMDLEESDG